MSGDYFSTTASDYTVFINGVTSAATITSVGVTGGTVTLAVGNNGAAFTLIGPQKINTPTQHLISHKKMRCSELTNSATTPLNNNILTLGTTKVSKIHAIYNDPTGSAASISVVPVSYTHLTLPTKRIV